LHDRPAMLNRRSRILVINQNGVYSGLGVDAVLGLKHFKEEQRCDELPGGSQDMQRYLKYGFKTGSEHWGVFNMKELAETPQFLQAAV